MSYVLLVVYFVSPFVLSRLHRTWGAIAAILGLWLPIEFRLFSIAGVPGWAAIAVGMAAGIFAFRSRSDLFDVSSAFDLRHFSLREAAINFALFAVVGLPMALAIGFIKPLLTFPVISGIPLLATTTFLFNALPEEILFRGVIQHAIERASNNRTVAAIAAALIFGAAHLNNGSVVPNYKYFGIATVAGLFYGRAWRTHRNVLTSAVTHTMVNSAWRLFLR